MFNLVTQSYIFSKVRSNGNAILSFLLVLCLGTMLSAYSPRIPWYLAVAIAAFAITLGLSGQLILFLLVYKGWERWSRKQRKSALTSFKAFARVIFNGYIRSLWLFSLVVLLLSFFHASIPEIIRAFAFLFMGVNIFITFLSSHPRTWHENADVPTVLAIGYGLQLVFLLLVKLIL